MRFAVYGAGGHSREVADALVACGHQVVGFVDDEVGGVHEPTGLPITGELGTLTFDALALGIGDNGERAALFARLRSSWAVPVLVHPLACVSASARLGDGVQVMQFVTVNASSVVGANTILNVDCHVAHNCRIGSDSHLAPGCFLGGAATVGSGCLIGMSAAVLPSVTVGDGAVVGAGAVVVEDVPPGAVVVGVPARPVTARHGESR